MFQFVVYNRMSSHTCNFFAKEKRKLRQLIPLNKSQKNDLWTLSHVSDKDVDMIRTHPFSLTLKKKTF